MFLKCHGISLLISAPHPASVPSGSSRQDFKLWGTIIFFCLDLFHSSPLSEEEYFGKDNPFPFPEALKTPVSAE